MSSSVNNQALSLQPAPTSASSLHPALTPMNRAGVSSQVLVPGHQLQALLVHQALNAATPASQAHPVAPLALQVPHFEAATSSGISIPNAFGEGVLASENCCKKKSRSHDPESRQGLTKCTAPGCDKCIHYDCYQAFLNQSGVKSVVFPASAIAGQPSGEAVCCSKPCQKKLVKILESTTNTKKSAGENERFLWDKDGKDGENDLNTSMSIPQALASCLTTIDTATGHFLFRSHLGSRRYPTKGTLANSKKARDSRSSRSSPSLCCSR
jgi:hypothetical protein